VSFLKHLLTAGLATLKALLELRASNEMMAAFICGAKSEGVKDENVGSGTSAKGKMRNDFENLTKVLIVK